LTGSVDRKNIHTIYLNTRDVITTLEVLGGGRGSLSRGTHTVLVVFTNEDARKIPKLSHVVGFEDLTLVRGTITIEGESDGGNTEVLLREGNTSTKRNLLKCNDLLIIRSFSVFSF
jgi:hypothetical protein